MDEFLLWRCPDCGVLALRPVTPIGVEYHDHPDGDNPRMEQWSLSAGWFLKAGGTP